MNPTPHHAVDPDVMRALGFHSKPANEAQKTWPHVSTDGDDVWWHPHGRVLMWVQGIPSYERLFEMIWNAGKREGDALRAEEIRRALGM